MPNVIAPVAIMVPRKVASRNRSSGTIAAPPARRSTAPNARKAATHTASADPLTQGRACASMAASARAPSASAPAPCPPRSNRRPRGSADFATARAARTRAATANGTTQRNTLRQPKWAISTPPRGGPIANATPLQLAQMPSARPRSAGSVQTTRMIAERGRHQQRRPDPGQRARADQDADTRRGGAQQGCDGESRYPDHEDAPAPEQVSEQAAAQQQHRVGQVIGIDHPLQPADAGAEIGPDRADGEIDHGGVHLRDQDGQAHGQQHHPVPDDLSVLDHPPQLGDAC